MNEYRLITWFATFCVFRRLNNFELGDEVGIEIRKMLAKNRTLQYLRYVHLVAQVLLYFEPVNRLLVLYIWLCA